MLTSFDSVSRAARHPITLDKPAVDFFSGALLGNGGMGVCVVTKPDAIQICISHNNVWDIRVAENHADKLGTFQEIFTKIQSIFDRGGSLKTDEWFNEYCKMSRENYARPYPRPFPCGSVVLGFDRRHAELLGHSLDIATGLCVINFLVEAKKQSLHLFADRTADRLWMRMVDENGKPCAAPFNRIRVMPDQADQTETKTQGWGAIGTEGGRATLPPPETVGPTSFRQVLRFRESCEPDARDKAVRLTANLNANLSDFTRAAWAGGMSKPRELERAVASHDAFVGCIQLDEGLASRISAVPGDVPAPTGDAYDRASQASRKIWADFWSKSGVAFSDDDQLERIWYRNLYFLNCAARPGVTCPGLFANWSFRSIGTAWHGDYHMNYNTQQPFWVTFSSNHVELHEPYVDLVHHILPISRKWAKEYYGLRGAYFPHSAYPTEMNIMPYPVPTWGWEICETPWSVQSLWWHYLYTMDEKFLRDRAFGPMKEAVEFLVDYMTRPDAHGAPRWKDDRYHIFPTVPPELYGLTDGWVKNYDCIVDLTLTKFVLNAFTKACDVLKRQSDERELLASVSKILAKFPDYPTADSVRGKVFVSAPGEHPDIVYNTPDSTMTVFPGEDHGLSSPPDQLQIARNSYRQQQNEGGNDLVFLPLQGARLGVLDLERFKRQVHYCTLPNGTSTDLAMQSGGRYPDEMAYDFMAKMGVWFENFALPVVINECLMQSYDGTIRLFPNWPKDKDAEFHNLRATGAFLVSASIRNGEMEWVEIMSEAGSRLRMIDPWGDGRRVLEQSTKQHEALRFARMR